MDRKPKMGIGAILLLGIIYTLMGGLFLVLGICLMLLPSDPESATTGSIFTLVGGIFLILGIVFLIIEYRKAEQARQLLNSGRYVWGEIIELAPNTSVRINGRHPYIAVVKHIDSRGQTHIFKSRNLRIYPDPSVIGKQVKIYYRDASYTPYYVDIESVLPNVIEH